MVRIAESAWINHYSITMKSNFRLAPSFLFIFLSNTIILYGLLVACSDPRLASKSDTGLAKNNADAIADGTPLSTVFSSKVGAPIDRPTAVRWMTNFTSRNASATAEFFISTNALKNIISDKSCVGISLWYAVDDRGNLQIFPVGVDAFGKTMTTNFINATSVSWQTASQWIANYNGAVRSHFFGSLIINSLLTGPMVRVSRAIDDSGSPQLLLSNASDPVPADYDDRSQPCPPGCPI